MMSIQSSEESASIGDIGKNRKRILVCVPRYLPGYKSGGPTRAVANMIAELGSYFEFFVVTRDRDATDTRPYPGIEPGRWHQVGNAQVLYCSSITSATLRQAFRDAQPDVIHLNSFQDKFTRVMVLLRRSGAFGDIPALLAPRGEFSPGAMEIKRKKKSLYRRAAKLIGLHEDLHWQVSAPPEVRDLINAAPARRIRTGSIHVVHEIFDGKVLTAQHPPKHPGTLKLAFISRISEMKNLHFILDILPEIEGRIALDIFGPVADKDTAYWERCKASLAKLPANITAKYFGSLDHSAVSQTLHDYHFFVLPTRGENYCHAAVESIINGTPVILSDATPWRDLSQARAGFDIALNKPAEWIASLQTCVDMDEPTYTSYLEGTREYGRRFSIQQAVEEHLAMFDATINQTM
jgi:glycosyltransferase involved in cell wall biosynthesis